MQKNESQPLLVGETLPISARSSDNKGSSQTPRNISTGNGDSERAISRSGAEPVTESNSSSLSVGGVFLLANLACVMYSSMQAFMKDL